MKPFNKVSTTNQQERERLAAQQISKSYFKTTIKYGVIKEIHEKLYAVSVLLNDGGPAFGGSFLPVTNPWQQLIHDFGNLRSGMLVEVSYSGDQENTSVVRVIGLEGEKIASLQQAPEVNLAMYEIFAPGT